MTGCGLVLPQQCFLLRKLATKYFVAVLNVMRTEPYIPGIRYLHTAVLECTRQVCAGCLDIRLTCYVRYMYCSRSAVHVLHVQYPDIQLYIGPSGVQLCVYTHNIDLKFSACTSTKFSDLAIVVYLPILR